MPPSVTHFPVVYFLLSVFPAGYDCPLLVLLKNAHDHAPMLMGYHGFR